MAVERADPSGIRAALLEIAQRPDELDDAAFDRAIGRFAARHLGPGAPSPAMFAELVDVVAGFGLAVPGDVAGAFRALVALEGSLALLAPAFDVVEESRRFAHAHTARAPCARRRPTSWPACSPRCAGCRTASSASPARSTTAASPSTSGCSPTGATAAS